MKIQGQNKEMLATACQMFMGKSEAEVSNIALETLEGHQRAIIAHLTVEVGYTPHHILIKGMCCLWCPFLFLKECLGLLNC